MRIISLLPAATDIVALLGAADQLVGVSHECDAVGMRASTPRVTSTAIPDGSAQSVDAAVRSRSAIGEALYDLDRDLIRALGPDLLLTQAVCDVCAVHESDVRSLAARLDPSATVITLAATTLDGVLADIERVACGVGLGDLGAAAVAALRERLADVHNRLRAALAPRPRVAVIEWPGPVFVAGHWVPDMVRRAGGHDVVGRSGVHSTVVSGRAIEAADPEILFVAPCGYDAARARQAADALLLETEWAWARDRPVWALDANTLTSRPGPALIRGVEVLAAALHPSLFPAADRREAAMVPYRPRCVN